LLIHKDDSYDIPRQLLIDELRSETRAPWWEIIGCIPSQIPGKRQLIIFVRCNTGDHQKVTWSVFQTGVLAERFAPNFDRYMLSLRSDRAWPGFAALDGVRLRALREQGRPLEEYRGVVENNLVFYVPLIRLPRFISRLETFRISLRTHVSRAHADFRKQLGKIEVVPRGGKMHRNGWRSVLNGQVWLPNDGSTPDQDSIRSSCRQIVRAALRDAQRQMSRLSLERYLPLGFARIYVFRRNYRKRRLINFGLREDLICTVQFQRIRGIRSPDILGSTVERCGRYRIAWNKAWLESHT